MVFGRFGQATAGTFSKIAPALKTGADIIIGSASAAAEATDPGFRAFSQGRRQEDRRQEELELKRQKGQREQEELAAKSETVVLHDVFTNATPGMIKAISERLRLKGAEVSPTGRTNKQQLVETLQDTDPEEFQEVFKIGIDELDRGIEGLEVQITKEAAKLGHSLFDSQGGVPLSDKEAARRVLADPQLVNSNKNLAQLVGTRDQNLKSLTGLNQMSIGLADEQKEKQKRRIRLSRNPITGELDRIDLDTGELLTVGDVQEGDEVVRDTAQAPTGTQVVDTQQKPFLTREDLLRSTGAVSGTLQAINNMFGFAKTGQIAPKTAESRNKVRIFNQNVKQALVINPRAPVAELNVIQGFLIDPGRFLVDPDEAVTKTFNLRVFLEGTKEDKIRALQRQDISKKQRAEFTEQVTAIDSVLGRIPTREQLSGQPQELDIGDIGSMDAEDIASLSMEDVNKLSDEQLDALEQRLLTIQGGGQ